MSRVRRAHGEAGVTLMELLISIAILGLIAAPITASIIVGLKTTDKAQATLSDGTSADLLNVYLAPDVQNTDPTDRLNIPSENTDNCGVSNAIVFNHLGGSKVSYAVETIDGEPALTRRDTTTGCSRQIIAPGLAAGYTLTNGSTLTVNCGSLSGACGDTNYSDLKLMKITLNTANGHSVTVRATTRT
jgi:prepilin-type N-terminal cleavage/methylation domain-containing protein